MSAREALAERVKKASDASRDQVHAYIGVNDYFYDRARRRPPRLSDRLEALRSDGAEPLRRTVEQFKIGNLRDTIDTRVAAVRERQDELAQRGETIVQDWHQAAAVKDAEALIGSVRSADGAADLAKSLRTWFGDYPAAAATPRKPAGARPAAKRSPKPRKAAVTKSAKPASAVTKLAGAKSASAKPTKTTSAKPTAQAHKTAAESAQ